MGKRLNEEAGTLSKLYGLEIVPRQNGNFLLEGTLGFKVEHLNTTITDSYEVLIEIPKFFPRELPISREIGGRIQKSFHTNPDGSLCLGTDLEITLVLLDNPSIKEYVEQLLIRYLFGHSYYKIKGVLPFGERSHGGKGILEFYAEYFGTKSLESAKRLLKVLANQKYSRNKKCPCGSMRKTRKCHGATLLKLMRSVPQKLLQKDWSQSFNS